MAIYINRCEYLELLKTGCRQERIEIWVYCLMTNHVHLILQPEKLRKITDDWKIYLKEAQGFQDKEFERHERTGRALGSEQFIERAERLLNNELKKKKPGPKGAD